MSNPNFEVLLISRLTLKIRHFIFATSGFIFNEKDKKGKKKKMVTRIISETRRKWKIQQLTTRS